MARMPPNFESAEIARLQPQLEDGTIDHVAKNHVDDDRRLVSDLLTIYGSLTDAIEARIAVCLSQL
jgi:hypothetical protein